VKVLTAEKAFLALSLYNTVRLSMTLFFPFAISMLGECQASITRVQDFLLLEERDQHQHTRTFHTSSNEVHY
jgi:ATP-binding cassette, subfamily C (CFTR/MRP), member 4